MVSHDYTADTDAPAPLERKERALQRLDDGHASLLEALAGLDEAEAFLGSRWSVWEVMQHLLTESFVQALEEIASGEREMLPAFDARGDRIAGDVAKLEANYQRFRALIAGLSPAQLDLPATPYNPENDYPALSLLDLIERVAGHEGNHARQVEETRKFVAAFRSAQRAVTVAGLGPGDMASVPTQTRELLANADYVVGSPAALAAARRWIRAVELPLHAENRAELVNRMARDARAGLWSMAATLGDPAESAPGLLSELESAVDAVSVIPAPGFYRLALAQLGLSPLEAVCASVERIGDVGGMAASGRAVVILGADGGGTWRDAARALAASGVAGSTRARLLANLSAAASGGLASAAGGSGALAAATVTTTLGDVMETAVGDGEVEVDSALVVWLGSR